MTEINKDDQRRIFSGWGTISIIDLQNDYIDVLKEFRDRGIMEIMMKRGAPVMDSHSNHQVGRILSYEYKMAPSGKYGLYLTAEIYKNYPSDDDMWEKIKEGAYTGFSLGGKASEKNYVCNESVCFNNLTGIESWEWSCVEKPANPEALIDNVNKLAKGYEVKKYKAFPILKYVHQCGEKWCVYSEDGKRLGTHPTKEDANRQLRAIEVNKYFTYRGGLLIDHNTEESVLPNGERKPLTNDERKEMIDTEINKSKAYIEKPSNAPPGVKIHTGSEGGLYYNTEDNYGNTSSHSKVRLKRPGDAPKGIKVREDADGFYYNSDDIQKAKVYIKTPSEAPSGLQVHVGPQGGKFYETEEIENRTQREKIEREQIKPQIKVKTLQEILGDEAYNRMDNWKAGRELKDLLNTYTKISTGTASDEEINRNFDFINKRLPEVYNFYAWAARDPTEEDTVNRSPEFRAEHKKVADNVKKVQNLFAQSKDRKDKSIAIDNFMNTSHTSGYNIVARLWNAWRSVEEKHDPDFVWVSDIPDKYMDYLRTNIGKSIQKAKVYIKTPSEAPQGVKVEQGPKGGHYYESIDTTQEKPYQQMEQPQEVIPTNPEEFLSLIHKVPEHMKSFLSSYTPEEIKQKGIKTYITKNKTAGVALNGDEITNLFSLQPGEGKKALLEAIANGGRRLDCFDRRPGENYGLPDYYSKFGFKEYKRERNWTPGGPDVVFMRLE